jgi:hypothetical protein
MTSILEAAGRIWREVAGRLTVRRDTAPIDSVTALQDFVATRSAYVGQKTLYEYVKARMGTRYPRMFEDDALMASLNIAKQHVFAACLSDLTIYAVAVATHDQPIGNDLTNALARQCYETGLRENASEETQRFSMQDAIEEFNRRLDDTDWRFGARQPENFTRSPRALFRWAPIAEALKRHDTEIVENSIRFAWRDVREQFRKRVDSDAICADWLRKTRT